MGVDGQAVDACGPRAHPWRNALLQRGNDLLRYKGILAVRGQARRLVFQGVHMVSGFDYGRPWAADEEKSTTIVLIGRQLDEEAIRNGFALACR